MGTARIRFMNNQYMSRNFTYSSQQSSFPASNVYNTSRSRVWKPAGNFEITTANNKLYISDGSNKTITLTAGSYTPASLASHIQTQLNASSSNWTCSYDLVSTFKFTIARSSGTNVLRKSQTTDAVWDTIGFTGNTDISSDPFVADEQRNHTSEWVKCDLGIPQQATFVGIISGIDEVFTLSETATVKIQANNIDYWNSPPVDITIPVDDSGCLRFIDTENTASYRFWRVQIVDRLNYLGPEGIKIAYIYVGDHVSMTTSNIATGFRKELVDPSNVLQSENGALFFETRPRYLSFSNAQVQLLSGSEQRELEQLFYDLGKREPFFVSIDPDLEVSATLGELTRFVVMTNNPTFDHVIRNYYNINFDMREAF